MRVVLHRAARQNLRWAVRLRGLVPAESWQRSVTTAVAAPAAATSAAASPVARRRVQFDLSREGAAQLAPRYQLPDDPELGKEEQKRIRLDRITSEDVTSQWPPPALITPSVWTVHDAVKRPHLWLGDETSIDDTDVGRFVKLPRDDLIEFLPEGACGELARDLTLIPSRQRPVGLMLRKLAVEMIMQLQELRDATNSRGIPQITTNGFLIDGKKGTGKSQILNLLAIWARKNGWLVVLEPVPSRYSKEIADIKRSNNGVYIQNEFAQQFLEATSISNRSMLQEIPVDLSAYGSRAIDGESIRETRRLYEPLIEKTVEQEVASQGLSAVERLQRIAAYKKQVRVPSMVEQLRNPVNVWEIVEFGLENDTYATQAMAEMFVQLQRQTTHPVLVIVDEWNECFPVSEYVSIRYDNTRFHGYIPAYHLTTPRAFHRWDGQKYRRGLKICATTWKRYKRRDYKPELLGVKDYQLRTLRGFTQHEFANYVAYLRIMNVLHHFPRQDLEYYYMLTQGNGYEARKLLSTLY